MIKGVSSKNQKNEKSRVNKPLRRNKKIDGHIECNPCCAVRRHKQKESYAPKAHDIFSYFSLKKSLVHFYKVTINRSTKEIIKDKKKN